MHSLRWSHVVFFIYAYVQCRWFKTNMWPTDYTDYMTHEINWVAVSRVLLRSLQFVTINSWSYFSPSYVFVPFIIAGYPKRIFLFPKWNTLAHLLNELYNLLTRKIWVKDDTWSYSLVKTFLHLYARIILDWLVDL